MQLRFAHVLPVLTLSVISATSRVHAQAPVPVPIIYEQLKPASVAPGGSDFTLNILGNFFHYGAVVYWNNTPLSTTVNGSRFISAIVPASVTATPQSAKIRVLNPRPYGGFSNILYFHVRTPASPIVFNQVSQYGLPAPPVVADLNSDGLLEGIAFNGYVVHTFLGSQDGIFGEHGGPIFRACPSSGAEVSIKPLTGDFNRDGTLDVVAQCTNGFSLIKGVGDGTFHSHQDTVADVPVDMQSADINQDGKLDLVYISQANNGEVVVALGNGDGTFQAPFTPLTNVGCPTKMVLGDFNRDGKLDIVMTAACSNKVLIAPGNGNGTFGAPAAFDSRGVNPQDVLAIDFNGDGALDLAVLNLGVGYTPGSSFNLTVFVSAGNGTFQGGSVHLLTSSSLLDLGGSLTAADFDGDGLIDLAVAIPETTAYKMKRMLVFSSLGTGLFSTPAAFALTPFYTDEPMGPFVSGDFNNDGTPDVSFADSYWGTELLQK